MEPTDNEEILLDCPLCLAFMLMVKMERDSDARAVIATDWRVHCRTHARRLWWLGWPVLLPAGGGRAGLN